VPTVIFGEKGVAKSTLALVFYICLTLPWVDNPLGLTAPGRSIPTLILDYELPADIALRNAKHFQEGMGLPSFPLYHRRSTRPLAAEVEEISQHIKRIRAEVLIIDSLARACGGELVKTEPANEFFEALDRLHITSLIIAQTSKDTETKRKTIYGNALFTYYARSIFELCMAEGMSANEIDVALFHRWANLTRRYPDMGFHLNFNEHKTTIESQSVSVAEFRGKVSLGKAILTELRDGKLSVSEITERLGGQENSIKVTLTRLKNKGQVFHFKEEKLWGLASQF